MSDMRPRRSSGPFRAAVAAGSVLAVVTALAAAAPAAAPSAASRVAALRQVPSATFWAAKQNEPDAPLTGGFTTAYEGNTETRFLSLVDQARSLRHTGHAWRNAGPYGGVVDVPNIGSGNELFGPVDGIGTSMAVDPGDASGKPVYLDTVGGPDK